MARVLSALAAALFLSVSSTFGLSAQAWEAGLPGEDLGSIALQVGAVSPNVTLVDGGSFDGGVAGGVTAVFWAMRHLGVRGSFLMGSTSGNLGPNNNSVGGSEDPSVWLYSFEAAARYPMGGDRFSWFPYVALGAGGKTYNWTAETTGWSREFTYAWTAAGGLDIRPTASPWYGFVVEVKSYTSPYKWQNNFWERPTVRDLVVTVGLSLNR